MRVSFESPTLVGIIGEINKFLITVTNLRPQEAVQPVQSVPAQSVSAQPEGLVPQKPTEVKIPQYETKITRDQITAILQTVTSEKSMKRAKELLAFFKSQKISEIPEEKYGEFYQACANALQS